MKKLFRFLKFWECWCYETQGDNNECPKHGFPPALVRVAVFMALAMIVIAALAYAR